MGWAPSFLHGWPIDGIGDRSGDRVGDLAIGEPFASPPRALSGAGFINADGFADLITAASVSDINRTTSA